MPRLRLRVLVALSLLVSLAAGGAYAQDASASDEPLRVAVREVPPFAMRDVAGNWEGLSVAIWQDVADLLDFDFDWVELSLDETLTALEAGRADVAIAALTITAERERRLDFSHPYFVSGISLAYRGGTRSPWVTTLRGFASLEFLSAVATLALVLLVAGFAVWLFERRKNAEQFGEGSVARGLGDGFWWSAVTMTTVGYGDKAPRTLGGRIVALIWMFASLIIIAGFTASIAASLTANRLETSLLRSRDLAELTVGVLADSAAEEYAASQGAKLVRFEGVEAALEALGEERVEVVLHDAPVLRHLARTGFEGLEVASGVLVRDDYAFGLPPGSPLREDLNGALLSILREPVWQEIRARYLGSEDDG